jgi:ParB family transcriptional regulator, chromosome partitioning protein
MSKRRPPDEWLAMLLAVRQSPATPLIPGGGAVTSSDALLEIPVDSLDANPYQTRTSLDEKSLQELADSIKRMGLLEPIVVRASGGGRHQVIAGERRVKACYMAGVFKVRAVICQVTDEEAAAMTIIENLLREDVNPMDQAHPFRRLANEFGLDHDQIADRTGKSRATVPNFLRLLHLPERVQKCCYSGALSLGHAKVLLALDGQPEDIALDFAVRVASPSVRKTEELIARFLHSDLSDPAFEHGRWLRLNLLEAERDLRETLSAKVVVIESRGEGHIRIPFADLYEFDRLYASLTGIQDAAIAVPKRPASSSASPQSSPEQRKRGAPHIRAFCECVGDHG